MSKFLRNINSLLNIDDDSISNTKITEGAKKLQQFYKGDIEEKNFVDECLHFKSYVQATKDSRSSSTMNLLEFLRDQNLKDVFPNINIALSIFFVMAVTNCSAERSFSVLKRIKN